MFDKACSIANLDPVNNVLSIWKRFPCTHNTHTLSLLELLTVLLENYQSSMINKDL